jgi:hypothetical protein
MISHSGHKTADKRLVGFLVLAVELRGSINQPYRFYTFPTRQYLAVLGYCLPLLKNRDHYLTYFDRPRVVPHFRIGAAWDPHGQSR